MAEYPEVLKLRRDVYALDAEVTRLSEESVRLLVAAYQAERDGDAVRSKQLTAEGERARELMMETNAALWALLEPTPAEGIIGRIARWLRRRS